MPRRVPRFVVPVLVAGFLLTRAAFFATTTAGEYALYHDYAAAARQTSLAELYRTRDVEYPPLGVMLGVVADRVGDFLPEDIGWLIAARPDPVTSPRMPRFEVGLGIVLFAVDLACLALVCRLGRKLYPGDGPVLRLARPVVYVAATSALGPILYDRQDLVVGLVAALALASFARGWTVASYAVLAAGVAYKLVPLLLFPLWVLAAAALRSAPATPRRFLLTTVREALVAGAILTIVPLLVYLTCGGERAFVFLKFHSQRGLQLEASPAWLVFLLDPATDVGHSFGSFTLRGALADRVASALTPANAAAAILAVLVTARGFWRAARSPSPNRNAVVAHLAAGSLLAWVGFILFGKVGSPQFFLWLAPLVPLLPFRGSDRWCVIPLLLAMLTATLIFPVFYERAKGEMIGGWGTWAGPDALGLVLLAARAALLAVAFVWLAAIVWRNNPALLAPSEAGEKVGK